MWHIAKTRVQAWRLAVGGAALVLAANVSSPATKWDAADIVARAKVLATTRIGSRAGSDGPVPVHHSWLKVLVLRKGAAGATVIVEWDEGPSSIPFLVGDTFEVFLSWDPKRRIYRATWQASAEEMRRRREGGGVGGEGENTADPLKAR
jgi:hypothetical protein